MNQPMTRDDLEAVIWRQLTALGVRTECAAHVRTIMAAADDYVTYTGGITADRRAALESAAPGRAKRLHYRHDDGYALCGAGESKAVQATATPRLVTCLRCRRSAGFPQQAAA